MKKKIIELKDINKSFGKGNEHIKILEDINLDIYEGEIIGFIGRSGCGKSTLLRIISGLIEATSGTALYKGKPLLEAKAKTSMVFQTFGLFPWLTVYQNIALGLEAIGTHPEIIHEKVTNALQLVGLGGFGEAYPREISGGMRQRVGFARAMVVDPEVLLMDEPFSALDYLTADSLKTDLLDLWFERSVSSIKSIIIVTHSIEEAVSLCDRIVVFSSNPGKIVDDMPVHVQHPREHDSKSFHDMLDHLYLSMTTKTVKSSNGAFEENIYMDFPQPVSVIKQFEFLNMISKKPYSGKAELKDVANALSMTLKELMPLLESLLLLRFVEIHENIVSLSSSGNIINNADDAAKKDIFREHLVKYVKFIDKIYLKLQEKDSLKKEDMIAMLAGKFSEDAAISIINATINWTRYADLFSYDAENDLLTLDTWVRDNV